MKMIPFVVVLRQSGLVILPPPAMSLASKGPVFLFATPDFAQPLVPRGLKLWEHVTSRTPMGPASMSVVLLGELEAAHLLEMSSFVVVTFLCHCHPV